MTITFTPFNDHELVGFSRESGDDDAKVAALRCLSTPIGGERFLSILELGAEREQQWYYARYSVAGGVLRLRMVDDALLASAGVTTAAELRAFLLSHLPDDRLYGGSEAEAPPITLDRVT
jgi:hypothetical protein